ncbi:hypothetical protein OFM88_28650, partial [Escherichia coli]|nr:hypothetical protein [Escherichia coli]
KVKLLLRFWQKISPHQSGSYGWFAFLQSFISYQPLERGKVKLLLPFWQKINQNQSIFIAFTIFTSN